MNKIIKNKIYTTLDQLYDELDKSYELKERLHFDLEFGELITNETRIKLLKDFIIVFKLLRKSVKPNEGGQGYNVRDKSPLKLLNNITDRTKLHFSQLKRMECKNLEDNKLYFTTLLRVAFNLCLSTFY